MKEFFGKIKLLSYLGPSGKADVQAEVWECQVNDVRYAVKIVNSPC